tara:strand:+ start:72 stop:593 length:522 start_codon:yes stop_codon:yes gene_type:complete
MPQESIYNYILLLSRKKLFYTKFLLKDTFQNRINLILIHLSFLLIKIKKNNNRDLKLFNQKLFDLVFKNIELNMREIGFSDTLINKNMKFISKIFYDILLKSEIYNKKNRDEKKLFLINFLDFKSDLKSSIYDEIIRYMDKYYSFCFDLSKDSVLKGDFKFNFNYKYHGSTKT